MAVRRTPTVAASRVVVGSSRSSRRGCPASTPARAVSCRTDAGVVRMLVGHGREPEMVDFEGFEGGRLRLGLRPAAQGERPRDLVADRPAAELIVGVLPEQSDRGRPPPDRLVGDVASKQNDAPGVWGEQSGDRLEQRRLAGAVGSDEGHGLTCAHGG